MERKIRTVPTSVKIPENLLRQMDKDIESTKDFANRTDFIVTAIRFYLDHRTDLIYKRNTAFPEIREKDLN